MQHTAIGASRESDTKTPVTLVLGATTNPARIAYSAVHRLVANGQKVIPVGIRKGQVAGLEILQELPTDVPIDTVTLYLNAANQKEYEDALIDMHPRRILFNPGTENPAFAKRASEEGIEVENACTLVLLATNSY